MLSRLLYHGPTLVGTTSIGHELVHQKVAIIVFSGIDRQLISHQPETYTESIQEWLRGKIFRNIILNLGAVLALGSLYGRVARLHVCFKTLTENLEVLKVETDREIMAIWRRYGFLWGSNEPKKKADK